MSFDLKEVNTWWKRGLKKELARKQVQPASPPSKRWFVPTDFKHTIPREGRSHPYGRA